MVSLRRPAPLPAPQPATPASAPRGGPAVAGSVVEEEHRADDATIVRTCLGPMALGWAIAALCGAALSWDGGGILFQVLDTQRPVVPNQRWLNIPLQVPVLLLSRFSDNVALLGVVFSLTLALVPLGALAASWRIVRVRAPELFVWPVLAIGLGLLPGLFNLTAEALVALALVWPLILATLVGFRRSMVPVLALLALLLAVSHPYAIGLFALLTALALLLQQRSARARPELAGCAFVFGGLAFLTALRFLLFYTSYESAQFSLPTLGWNFMVSLRGYPIAALVCTAVATATLLLPRAARFADRGFGLVRGGCFALIGVFLTLWARDPQQWWLANRYTYPALLISLAFIGLATREGLRHQGYAEAARGQAWVPRLRAIQAVALIFALVLSVQSAAWFNLTGQFRRTIATSPWACISLAPQGWLQRTPLNQFAAPSYALLLQGRTPERLVLTGNGCGEEQSEAGVGLNQFYVRGWEQGWFDLRPLRARLVAEQQTPRDCSFLLTTGWYDTETSDPYWWRWSDGRDARMRVLVAADGRYALNGQIEAAQVPGVVNVTVNGSRVATVPLDQPGLRQFGPIILPLRSGENQIQFTTDTPAIGIGGRSLAFDVANLALTASDTGQPCRFQP